MKKLITILVLVVALALIPTLTACDKEPTTLVVMAPDGAPAMALAGMMRDVSKLGDTNLDYRIIDGPTVASSMLNGEADFIIAPTNAGMQMAIKTGNYVLASVTSHGNLAIVSTLPLETYEESNNGHTFLTQFIDRTITTIGSGQVPDVALKHLLSIDSLNTVVAPASEAALIQQGLKNGDIQIAVLGEPAATATANKIPGVRILGYLCDVWEELLEADFPQAGLFVKKGIAADKQLMTAFLSSLSSSIETLNKDKVSAIDLGSYMFNRGDNSLSGPAVGNSYIGMKQRYQTALSAKDSVVTFIKVLGVPYDESKHAHLFYAD